MSIHKLVPGKCAAVILAVALAGAAARADEPGNSAVASSDNGKYADKDGNPTLIDFGASRAAMAGRTVAMTAIFTRPCGCRIRSTIPRHLERSGAFLPRRPSLCITRSSRPCSWNSNGI